MQQTVTPQKQEEDEAEEEEGDDVEADEQDDTNESLSKVQPTSADSKLVDPSSKCTEIYTSKCSVCILSADYFSVQKEGDVKSVESSSGDEAEKDRDHAKGAQTPKSQPSELFESFQV